MDTYKKLIELVTKNGYSKFTTVSGLYRHKKIVVDTDDIVIYNIPTYYSNGHPTGYHEEYQLITKDEKLFIYFKMTDEIRDAIIEYINPNTLLDRIELYLNISKEFEVYSPAFGTFEDTYIRVAYGLKCDMKSGETKYIKVEPVDGVDTFESCPDYYPVHMMCSDNGDLIFDECGNLITNPDDDSSIIYPSPEQMLFIKE